MTAPVAMPFQQYFDRLGKPLAGGSVEFCERGSATRRTVWSDADRSTALAQPVRLDAEGRASAFGEGHYRVIVRDASGAIVSDRETLAPRHVPAPLATEITGSSFAADLQEFATIGFSTAGKGAARYVRMAEAPAADEQGAGLGRWLFRSNGGSVWWRLAEERPTDLMFGVLADATVSVTDGSMEVTGHDDTAALQAAVDYIAHFPHTTRHLRLPQGIRRLTDTIQIGRGHDFVHWTIEGDSSFGILAPDIYNSGIFGTFTDRPMFNIQGARNSRLAGLAFYGRNDAWLRANYHSMRTREPLENWRGPDLPEGRNTRYAPYCAISVDALSGPVQAESHYPEPGMPPWTGIPVPYDRARSSAIRFEDLTCSGFEVGLAVQPNLMPAASNAEFLKWRDCDFSFNLIATSISHSDARLVSFRNCHFHFCHTKLDSVTYGSGDGNVAASFIDCSFDNLWRALNVELAVQAQPFAPTIVYLNPYCEAVHSLGTVHREGAGDAVGSIRVIGGELGFFNFPDEYSPASYLEGAGKASASFEGVTINGTFGVFAVNCRLDRYSGCMPRVGWLAFDSSTLAGRRAASTCAGLFAPRYGEISNRPYVVFSTAAHTLLHPQVESEGWNAAAAADQGSPMPIPLFARSMDAGGAHVPLPPAPREVLDRAEFGLTGLTQNGIEWSFTADRSFLSDPEEPEFCLGAGDLVRDEASGHMFYVTQFADDPAAGTVALTLRQVTGVHAFNDGSWASGIALDPSQGRLTFICARRYVAGLARPLALQTEAGSSTAEFQSWGTLDLPAGELGTIWPQAIAEGHYLLASAKDSAMPGQAAFAKARIAAIARDAAGTPTGTVTIDRPARLGGLFHAPPLVAAP